MKYSFMAHTAEARVTVDNLNLLSYDDITEYWKERKYGRHSRFSVDDEEGDMVDF